MFKFFSRKIERLNFEIVVPFVFDTIVGAVVGGALEIVIALVTFDMTHEDSENPLGEDQTFSLERATPYPLSIPGEVFEEFSCVTTSWTMTSF